MKNERKEFKEEKVIVKIVTACGDDYLFKMSEKAYKVLDWLQTSFDLDIEIYLLDSIDIEELEF